VPAALNDDQSSRNVPQPGPSGPLVLVIFGASGDLTSRKLLPALFHLSCQGLLPARSLIIGFARSDKTDESFRRELCNSTCELLACDGRKIDNRAWKAFASRIFYHRGAYDNPADFVSLGERIQTIVAEAGEQWNYVYYLATPPSVFAPIIKHIGMAGLAAKVGDHSRPRIVIEKPFGRDLQSARQLNQLVRSVFDEDQIFRIDHYLGKETVQNIMVLRFANSIFEHIWNHDYIDHVQITVAETLGVGRRGRYYDQAGAIRDMVQNHMMHLLCLVAMEPPVTLAADAIRDEKVKVLIALRPISARCAADEVVRGQYGTGRIGETQVPAYRRTSGVDANSETETFVAFKVHIDNWRWADVPFYLRTGKCLPRRCTEISIHFKAVAKVLFNRSPARPLSPNVLTIRIQPNEGMSLAFQVKVPGPAMNIHTLDMDFDYAESFGSTPPDAYERLLLDVASGDATLFTRSDEIEAAWRFVTPIIEGCSRSAGKCIDEYPAGTWGPDQADALIRADGRAWHLT